MTDDDFRDLFARLDEADGPRPEFVDRLLADFDELVRQAAPAPDARSADGWARPDTDGSANRPSYLGESGAHPMVNGGGPRPRKGRIIVALAVAAVIATAVVAATHSTGSHQPGSQQTPIAPVTTAPPVTTEAPTTPPSSTPDLSNTFTACEEGPSFTPAITGWPYFALAAPGMRVHVLLKGCAPGGTYLVAECGDGLGHCLHQSAVADAIGTVSMDITLQKVFPGVDCAVNPPGCSFGVFHPVGNFGDGFTYANVPLTFSASP